MQRGIRCRLLPQASAGCWVVDRKRASHSVQLCRRLKEESLLLAGASHPPDQANDAYATFTGAYAAGRRPCRHHRRAQESAVTAIKGAHDIHRWCPSSSPEDASTILLTLLAWTARATPADPGDALMILEVPLTWRPAVPTTPRRLTPSWEVQGDDSTNLVVDAMATRADGHAEREAAKLMIAKARQAIADPRVEVTLASLASIPPNLARHL